VTVRGTNRRKSSIGTAAGGSSKAASGQTGNGQIASMAGQHLFLYIGYILQVPTAKYLVVGKASSEPVLYPHESFVIKECQFQRPRA
jgi:hypothetical protein